jgi:actin-like ATPase involved in cell morphogenesis
VYGAVAIPSNTGATHTGVVLEACREALDAAVLVPEAVAIAYGVTDVGNTLVVEITSGRTEVFVVRGAAAEGLSAVPVGADHADAAFESALLDQHPTIRASASTLREIKDQHASADGPVVVSLPTKTGPQSFDISTTLRRGFAALVRPVTTAVKAALVALEPDERMELVRNIVLAGPGSRVPGLDRGVANGLKDFAGASVRVIPDPIFGSAVGALELALGMPESAWRELLANRPQAGTELAVVHSGHPAVPGPRAVEYLARKTG